MAKIDQNSFFNRTNTQPSWMAEPLGPQTLIPGGARLDTTTFTGVVTFTATVAVAGALAGATSIPIDAYTGELIRAGSFLEFAGNEGTYFKLTADLNNGDTAISVEPTPVALVDDDVLNYKPNPKTIQAGSVIGRTFAQRDADTPFHKAADTDEEFYLIAYDVIPVFGLSELGEYDVEMVRPGSLVKENLLPTFAAESATIQAALQAAYVMTVGAE